MGTDGGSQFELRGPAREQALCACVEQLRVWGISMPDVAPIVRDFGLDQFDRVGEIEFWIANKLDEGYCGKFIFVFDGQTCPYHRHGRKHETFFIQKGRVRLCVDGHDRVMNEGDVLDMPPGVKHSFTGIGPALLLEVSMACIKGDNFFEDARIGNRGRYDHDLLLDPGENKRDGGP